MWQVNLNPRGKGADIYDLKDVQNVSALRSNYRDFSGRFELWYTVLILFQKHYM